MAALFLATPASTSLTGALQLSRGTREPPTSPLKLTLPRRWAHKTTTRTYASISMPVSSKSEDLVAAILSKGYIVG
ncbi:unnamed protein product [Ilex paraguariensis]|uniref:Uncharacterized protein n=1 Tax=Ilex paraguariensis TaxID=185542 RepID=A0ABC8SBI4_9AQUA